MNAVVALAVGIIYWWMVSRWSGQAEPWDAACYWSVFYPGSLALAGLLGWLCPYRGWALGAIVVLAQLPVVIVASGAGPLIAVGVLLASVLALPATVVAALAGWIRVRAAR